MDDHFLTTHRRLYRSRDDRLIAGVAGGLAHYFNIDPVLVRLGFVLLGALTGIGLIAYIILAIVVPERPLGMIEPIITSTLDTRRGRQVGGLFLLGIGGLLLAGNLGLWRIFEWNLFWPLVLIGAGALLLLNRTRS